MINTEELYVIKDGNRYKVDISSPSGITLSFESNLFNAIDKISCSRSYTIRLPKTINNSRIFYIPQDIRVKGEVNKIKYKCEYIVDGFPIIRNGNCYVTSIDDNINITITWDVVEGLQKIYDDNFSINYFDSKENVNTGVVKQRKYKDYIYETVYGVESYDNYNPTYRPFYVAGIDLNEIGNNNVDEESLKNTNNYYPLPVVPTAYLLRRIENYYGIRLNIYSHVSSDGKSTLTKSNVPAIASDVIDYGCIPCVSTKVTYAQNEQMRIRMFELYGASDDWDWTDPEGHEYHSNPFTPDNLQAAGEKAFVWLNYSIPDNTVTYEYDGVYTKEQAGKKLKEVFTNSNADLTSKYRRTKKEDVVRKGWNDRVDDYFYAYYAQQKDMLYKYQSAERQFCIYIAIQDDGTVLSSAEVNDYLAQLEREATLEGKNIFTEDAKRKRLIVAHYDTRQEVVFFLNLLKQLGNIYYGDEEFGVVSVEEKREIEKGISDYFDVVIPTSYDTHKKGNTLLCGVKTKVPKNFYIRGLVKIVYVKDKIYDADKMQYKDINLTFYTNEIEYDEDAEIIKDQFGNVLTSKWKYGDPSSCGSIKGVVHEHDEDIVPSHGYSVDDLVAVVFDLRPQYGGSYINIDERKGFVFCTASCTDAVEDVIDSYIEVLPAWTEGDNVHNQDIITNLPDITCLDFVKSLFYMTGSFPFINSKGEITLGKYNAIHDNYLVGNTVDWSNKYIPNDNDNIDWRVGGFKGKNWYLLKNDEETEELEDKYEDPYIPKDEYEPGMGVINVNDERNKEEATIIKLPWHGAFLRNADNPKVGTGNTVKYWSVKYGELLENLTASQTKPCYGMLSVEKLPFNFLNVEMPNRLQMSVWNDFKDIEIREEYSWISKVLKNASVLKCELNLNPYDLYNLDYLKPVYIQKFNSYFCIIKIERSSNGTCKAELLRIPPESL